MIAKIIEKIFGIKREENDYNNNDVINEKKNVQLLKSEMQFK